jgi:hypothetical protein
MTARKYHFTAEEAAEMRYLYDHAPLSVIATIWGVPKKSIYDVCFRLFKEHDLGFEAFCATKKKPKVWCDWCGNDIDTFKFSKKKKYCDDPECIAERKEIKPPTKVCAECGGPKSSRKRGVISTCMKCYLASCDKHKERIRRAIKRMTRDGYTTKQISRELNLSRARIQIYRTELGLPIPRRRRWLPEQEEYWKAMVTKAGSIDAVWSKSGITRSAFVNRLRHIGYVLKNNKAAMEARAR